MAPIDRPAAPAQGIVQEVDPDHTAGELHPEVSAVMPCLNEAATIQTCITKAQACFARLSVSGEVIVADNGSTDGSQELARALGARVVDVPRRGYGAALMGGIEAANGDIIIMADADDSYDWSDLEPFIQQVRDGADLVMGNRFKGGIRPGAMKPLHRYVGNPLLSAASRLAYRTNIGDFHCGMRAFTPQAYRRMRVRTPGMEFATEMVAGAVRSGLRIDEVPVVLYPDGRDRAPHLRSFRDGWRHLRYIASSAPDILYILPALFAMFIGLTLAALLAMGPATIGPFRLGIHFLALSSLLIMVALNMLIFGSLSKLMLRRRYPDMRSVLVDWLLRSFHIEQGLLLGGALFVCGFAVDVAIFLNWLAASGGPTPNTVHPSFVATTAIVAGVNIVFASFLIHLVVEEMRDEPVG